MFRRIDTAGQRQLSFTLDGTLLSGIEGDTVATALLASGITVFRHSPVKQTERGPLCMMGVCFECLVSVDGSSSIQACLTPLKDGMVVVRPLRHRAGDGVTSGPL